MPLNVMNTISDRISKEYGFDFKALEEVELDYSQFTYVNTFNFLNAEHNYRFYVSDTEGMIIIDENEGRIFVCEREHYDQGDRILLQGHYHLGGEIISNVTCREQSEYRTLYRF